MTNDDNPSDPKNLAFYSSVVEAWIATKMQKDRSLLTLSSAGVGLIATLVSALSPSSWSVLTLLSGGALAFLVTIVSVIRAYERNADHLKAIVNEGTREDDPKLLRLDKTAFWGFVIGVALTGIGALVSNLQDPTATDEPMTADKSKPDNAPKTDIRSLSGLGDLAPKTPQSESSGDGSAASASGRTPSSESGGSRGASSSGDSQGE